MQKAKHNVCIRYLVCTSHSATKLKVHTVAHTHTHTKVIIFIKQYANTISSLYMGKSARSFPKLRAKLYSSSEVSTFERKQVTRKAIDLLRGLAPVLDGTSTGTTAA